MRKISVLDSPEAKPEPSEQPAPSGPPSLSSLSGGLALQKRRRGGIMFQEETSKNNELKRHSLAMHFQRLITSKQTPTIENRFAQKRPEPVRANSKRKMAIIKPQGETVLSGDLQQIQQLLQSFKQDIQMMNQSNQQNDSKAGAALAHEPSCEYEYYFPWNNLNLVLIRRNFKKMAQLQNIKNRKNKTLTQNNQARRSMRNSNFLYSPRALDQNDSHFRDFDQIDYVLDSQVEAAVESSEGSVQNIQHTEFHQSEPLHNDE